MTKLINYVYTATKPLRGKSLVYCFDIRQKTKTLRNNPAFRDDILNYSEKFNAGEENELNDDEIYLLELKRKIKENEKSILQVSKFISNFNLICLV